MALYAATACSSEIRSAISRIYLNDSPGLTPGLYDEAAYEELRGRILQITPQYSLVGRLFARRNPDRIVACGTPQQIAACPESVTGRYL